ncbi:MAG TPA: hypothetical protein VN231_01060 [Allosphingosinicella sp.]|nr:hypothetical protein [Allosphingosinicella sp.]
MILAESLLNQARRHWFLPLLPALLAAEYGFARSTDWARPGPAEAAILFDLCLFVPFLYLVCYRGRLARTPLAMRAAGLALLGLWIASILVPPERGILLSRLTWLRPLGLALLVLIELKLSLELIRMVLSGRSDPREIAARSGAPHWAVRLMLIEARFWKWVWRLLRRK